MPTIFGMASNVNSACQVAYAHPSWVAIAVSLDIILMFQQKLAKNALMEANLLSQNAALK
jgi:hypothetical protein